MTRFRIAFHDGQSKEIDCDTFFVVADLILFYRSERVVLTVVMRSACYWEPVEPEAPAPFGLK